MDRLKLETNYLRALDMLMSADEYQLQAAILRLDRARLACTDGECRGLSILSAVAT